MFFFGHIGISTRIIHKLQPKADLRWVAVLSILPDILDKPVALTFSEYFGRNSRLFGHTLMLGLTFIVFLWWKRTRWKKNAVPFWPYAVAFFSHHALDKIWEGHLACFFWPALGPFPRFEKEIYLRWFENILKPYSLGGELIGLFFLAQLFIRYGMSAKDRRKKFMHSGVLEPAWQTEAKHRGR